MFCLFDNLLNNDIIFLKSSSVAKYLINNLSNAIII